MKTVKHTRDTLPPLTEAQKDNLKRLAAKPDDEIDTSDIPELTDAQLAKMKRHVRYLRYGQEADHGPSGHRCTGLAKDRRQGLPIPNERNPATGNAERETI